MGTGRLRLLERAYNAGMGAKQRLARWETLGAVWTIVAGVPLHFLYSATGWAALAWLGPINESTWEHFKLAFWPTLAWAALEWRALSEHRDAFWTGKLAALVAMPLLIASIFYGYTAVVGKNLLEADIATFVIAVAVGQWIGFRVITQDVRWRLAPCVIALLAAMFVAFSFSPPGFFLFEDPRGK